MMQQQATPTTGQTIVEVSARIRCDGNAAAPAAATVDENFAWPDDFDHANPGAQPHELKPKRFVARGQPQQQPRKNHLCNQHYRNGAPCGEPSGTCRYIHLTANALQGVGWPLPHRMSQAAKRLAHQSGGGGWRGNMADLERAAFTQRGDDTDSLSEVRVYVTVPYLGSKQRCNVPAVYAKFAYPDDFDHKEPGARPLTRPKGGLLNLVCKHHNGAIPCPEGKDCQFMHLTKEALQRAGWPLTVAHYEYAQFHLLLFGKTKTMTVSDLQDDSFSLDDVKLFALEDGTQPLRKFVRDEGWRAAVVRKSGSVCTKADGRKCDEADCKLLHYVPAPLHDDDVASSDSSCGYSDGAPRLVDPDDHPCLQTSKCNFGHKCSYHGNGWVGYCIRFLKGQLPCCKDEKCTEGLGLHEIPPNFEGTHAEELRIKRLHDLGVAVVEPTAAASRFECLLDAPQKKWWNH